MPHAVSFAREIGRRDILIVAATKSEIFRVLKNVEVCITGIGVHFARRKLREALETRPSPSLILSTGVSGALTGDLLAGKIIMATKVLFGDAEYETARVHLSQVPYLEGPVYCSSKVVGSRIARTEIFKQTGALCVDMESGAIAEIGKKYGIPVAVIRVIMDGVDDRLPEFESPEDDVEMVEIMSRISLGMKIKFARKAIVAVLKLNKALLTLLDKPTRIEVREPDKRPDR